VDTSHSIWLKSDVRGDFDAETVLQTVADFFQEHGLPGRFTFDRDPRSVGSASGRDFPSALVRFLLCLGVQPTIGPPHRPDKKASVERLHRTLGEQCLQVHLPRTLSTRQGSVLLSGKQAGLSSRLPSGDAQGGTLPFDESVERMRARSPLRVSALFTDAAESGSGAAVGLMKG
jgi:hypothetical protein